MVYIDWVKLRKHFGKLNQKQVDGFNHIIESTNNYNINALKTAYILATAWHETAKTMQPIEEYGKGRGKRYGKHIDINGTVYTGLKHIYYGRGYVQLTWLTNYVKLGKKLNIDLVNKPELALDPKYASDIMCVGMLEGLFTGKSLNMIKSSKDYEQARKIINGMDKSSLIAGYANKFLDCLSES